MNKLELKGGMVELIGKVKNKELLQHLYEIISEVLEDTAKDSMHFTPDQEKSIDEDIKASKNPKNLVDNKLAIKKMSKWLKK